MKKSIFKIIAVMLTFVIMSLPVFSNLSAAEVENQPPVDINKVLETRFLNMLNHNYVYGEDFEDLEKIVNNSIIALLEQRDFENEDYISETIVNGYLNDMYGFEIADFSQINRDFDYQEGFVYIIPRGFTRYEHKAVAIKTNEDGTYTFTTLVTIRTHDGCSETLTSETLFAKNSSSVFGFNIVSSYFLEDLSHI